MIFNSPRQRFVAQLKTPRSYAGDLGALRSADPHELFESGAEERVATFGDGRGVERAAVAGEPRPTMQHSRRVERGDRIPVGHCARCPASLSLPALQHIGRRVLAVLKGHLHPQAAEVDSWITNPGRLPVDQRDATVALK